MLSKRAVYSDVSHGDGWNNHVELGLWADAYLVAPATATTLSKMATGNCDTMLLATYLSARCPVFIAPAMDVDMWHHPATRRNIATLTTDGCQLIPVGTGELASGLVGEGRMAEPEDIVAHLEAYFNASVPVAKPLAGKHCLVTTGPTHEPLDPVRFLGNRSTGKMGFAIAEALADAGATVTLVTGPVALTTHTEGIKTIRVETARQMYEASLAAFATADIAVLAAAVADYRPTTVATEKIKKTPNTEHLTLTLETTEDIAKALGARKSAHQTLVGFALETNNEAANAQSKLERKHLDLIVLNSLRDDGAGFGYDTNKVTIFDARGNVTPYPLQSKAAVALAIVAHIAQEAARKAGAA